MSNTGNSDDAGVVTLAWEAGADVAALLEEHLRTARRVQAYLDPHDGPTLRAAARAGMRREGLVRAATPDGDRWLYARLATDVGPGSPHGRSAVLDTTMPVKRVIAQGLLRDEHGRVLVCETTYKRDWDLPGGIVDPDEAPADTVGRELCEELGLDLPVGRLLVISWLPRYLGWSDAVQLVYDLGTVDADITDRMILSAQEIRSVHWVENPSRCAPYERSVIEAARSVGESAPPVELQAGVPR